jgi:hypothetical protein
VGYVAGGGSLLQLVQGKLESEATRNRLTASIDFVLPVEIHRLQGREQSIKHRTLAADGTFAKITFSPLA